MSNLPQIAMAAWFILLFIGAFAMLLNPRLPFILPLDRRAQRRILFGTLLSATVEVVTLALGGFWS